MTNGYTFIRAHAAHSADGVGVIAVPDSYIEFAPPCSYMRCRIRKDAGPEWGGEKLDYWITGFSTFARKPGQRERVCAISAEGDVIFFEDDNHYERIQGAGLASSDSRFYGRMEDIAAVGSSLFACGGGGQIYRRLGDDQWQCLAPHLLRKPTSSDNTEWFVGIGGASDTDVYFAGKGGHIAHWDGKRISVIETPTRAFLVWVQVETETSIWLGGAEGALLHGNWRDGFRLVPGISGVHHLNAAAIFAGRLFIGSSSSGLSGIYAFENSQLKRVATGLKPEPEDVSFIGAGAGVLWAIGGGKDIVRFDGKAWKRIDFPLNAPIR